MSSHHAPVDVTVAQLRTLVALAQHASFTGAGLALGLTQSAVSRNVAALEAALEATVVVRGRGAARLTTLGETVLEHARVVLLELEKIERAAHSAPNVVRIGAVASALVRLLPAAFERERPRHASFVVREGDDDELEALQRGGRLDLLVTSRPATHWVCSARRCTAGPSCSPRLLELRDEFVAVLPRRHPLAEERRVEVAELVAAGVADPGGTCGPVIARELALRGIPWNPRHVVRDPGTIIAMATAGITPGIVPALAIPTAVPPEIVVRALAPGLHRTLHVAHCANDVDAAEFASDMREVLGTLGSGAGPEVDHVG